MAMSSPPPQQPQPLKVIIAGGGIVGLTLANALQHANIDYLLLEGRDSVAPKVGASIAFFPNGSRILHQLGCYEPLWEHTVQVYALHEHDQKGKLFRTEPKDAYQWLARRTGFHVPFIDRHHVLELLYGRITDKSKILTGKKILRAEESEEGVTVICADGTTFQGAVLAGADGVRSKVRNEMWRIADEREPGFIPRSDKTNMFAEYRCLFGISRPSKLPAPPGTEHTTYQYGLSSIVVCGKTGDMYWFMFQKLDRIYKHDEIPRYSDKDALEFAESIADFPIQTEEEFEGRYDFRDIWRDRRTYMLVPLEEAQYKKWTFGRIACLGDAIHKGTPNAGPGGNGGIESAAALANAMYLLQAEINKTGNPPTRAQVTKHLVSYQEVRRQRANAYLDSAKLFTYLQALHTWPHKMLTFWMSTLWEGTLVELFSDQCQNASKIDFLPTPERSMTGLMPFNPEQGAGCKESVPIRMLFALPLLALAVIAYRSIVVESKVRSGVLTNPGPLAGPPGDDLRQLMYNADYGVLFTIVLIESARPLANAWTFAAFPTVVGLLCRRYSTGFITQIYFLLNYLLTPIQLFRSTEVRTTNLRWTKGVLPAMLLGYYIPQFLFFCFPIFCQHSLSAGVFANLFPVGVTKIQSLLADNVFKDTWRHDRGKTPLRDLPVVEYTLRTAIAIAAATSVFARVLAATSWTDFLETPLTPDYAFTMLGAFVWLALYFLDMKAVGMIETSWSTIVFNAVTTCIVAGPGATLGLGWLWREKTLAYKRHRSAVVRDDSARFAGKEIVIKRGSIGGARRRSQSKDTPCSW